MPRGSHRTSRSHQLDATGTSTSTAGKPTHWEQLLAVLDALRAELKANYVPAFLQRKLFVQLFSFINVQLFNQLLLRRECCSFANGEYVKNGLAQVRSCPSLGCCLCVLFRTACLYALCVTQGTMTSLGCKEQWICLEPCTVDAVELVVHPKMYYM
jgi:hypothetical protein